ncbi:hypothetical protein [Streptomyces bacillaris]|uniref:hypothetical protein n=1 Tax=Streptomyces bacillaris TaxID=68179 RepID=UPI003EBA1BD5
MTPQQMNLLLDFLAHDVAGNVVAAMVVGALVAAWRGVVKRLRSANSSAPRHLSGPEAPPQGVGSAEAPGRTVDS